MSKPTVIVTGASSGIGKSVCEHFVNMGFRVAGISRRSIAKESFRNPDLFNSYVCDVSSKEQVNSVFSQIIGDEPIILINAAGITSFNAATDDSVDVLESVIQTNLLGSIYTIKAVLNQMVEKKQGVIVSVLSVVAEKIFTRSSAYSASKSGLAAFTKVLREEVRTSGVKVINVYPGATDTPIWSEGMLTKFSSRMMKTDEVAKIIFDVSTSSGSPIVEEIVLRPQLGDL